MVRPRLSERDGQGTVEYVGIVLLVALLFGALLAVSGLGDDGLRLGRVIAERIVCAVRGSDSCELSADDLVAAYGPGIAVLARANAPEIRFEDADSVSLPVDPRRCREHSCADTSARGSLERSAGGEPASVLVHVVDCRAGEETEGADCSGDRAGRVYIQYWLYYPDSATKPFGSAGFHEDDWESYQVRVNADGTVDARASSHSSYNYDPEPINLSDIGSAKLPGTEIEIADFHESAWDDANGFIWVSDGSHAGRAAGEDHYFRSVAGDRLRLIPLEANVGGLERLRWDGITPPWLKPVYRDPEDEGT